MAQRNITAKQGRQRFRLIGEIVAELRKVVWLSRREIVYLTVLVLIVSIAMGAFLGFIDLGFTKLVNNVFLGG